MTETMRSEPLIDTLQEYHALKRKKRRSLAYCVLFFLLAGVLATQTIDKGDWTSPGAVLLWVLIAVSLFDAVAVRRTRTRMQQIERELAATGRTL